MKDNGLVNIVVEGEFQKRTLLIMGTGTLTPPRTPEAMRDRINTILGEFLKILDEGAESTIDDIPMCVNIYYKRTAFIGYLSKF